MGLLLENAVLCLDSIVQEVFLLVYAVELDIVLLSNLRQDGAHCVSEQIAVFTLLCVSMSTGGREFYALCIAECVFSAVISTQILHVATAVRTVARLLVALCFLEFISKFLAPCMACTILLQLAHYPTYSVSKPSAHLLLCYLSPEVTCAWMPLVLSIF